MGVQEEDKGNYTCTASNAQGSISHTIKIDVVSKLSNKKSKLPKILELFLKISFVCAVAPKFVVRPENTTAVEGLEIMLSCVAEGDPKPTIQWDKNSRMNNLNDDRFVTFTNGSLYIREVYMSDEGSYGCTAGNSGGLKREELYLTVRGIIIQFPER